TPQPHGFPGSEEATRYRRTQMVPSHLHPTPVTQAGTARGTGFSTSAGYRDLKIGSAFTGTTLNCPVDDRLTDTRPSRSHERINSAAKSLASLDKAQAISKVRTAPPDHSSPMVSDQ